MRDRRSLIALSVLSVILLAGFADDASGTEWVYFATTAKGTHYYDRQTVSKANASVSVREKTIYNEDGKRSAEKFLTGMGEYKGRKLDHVITVSECNCKTGQARSLSMVIYDIDGKRAAGSPAGGSPWRDVAPGTLHERLFQQLCK